MRPGSLLAARGIGALEFGAIPKLPELPELPKLPKVGKKLSDAPEADVIVSLRGNAKGWLRVAIALAAYAGPLGVAERDPRRYGDGPSLH